MAAVRFDRLSLRDAGSREEILLLLEEALEAVSPGRVIREHVAREGASLRIGDETYPLAGRRVLLLGAGKASAAMAQELETILGDALTAGVVVTRYDYSVPTKRVRVYEGGHPLPDANGAAGAEAVRVLAQEAREEDLVLCLLSGGGSALLGLPVPGIDLEDLRELTGLLLSSGAAIDEVNAVRRHVTSLLGGGLAALLARAHAVSLLLSDVPHDRIEAIASGPTVPDPTTFRDAQEALRRLELWERVPRSVRERIEQGVAGAIPETPKPGDPLFARARAVLVGTNRTAVASLAGEGERRGFAVRTLGEPVVGEARAVGERLAGLGRALAGTGTRGALLVAGGETTVVVRGSGVGGRNQEVALAAAVALEGVAGVLVAALATDGTDGPTSAAGAIVDGKTVRRARALGLDPKRALEENDSYPLLRATQDLLVTGPTRTNVADLFLVFGKSGNQSAKDLQ